MRTTGAASAARLAAAIQHQQYEQGCQAPWRAGLDVLDPIEDRKAPIGPSRLQPAFEELADEAGGLDKDKFAPLYQDSCVARLGQVAWHRLQAPLMLRQKTELY